MSKRFLDVFCVSFLFGIIMMIFILVLNLLGINVIGDTVLTIFLVGTVSIFASYIIYKWYISSINSLFYELGATDTGIEYRKTLVKIAKKFQDRTLEIHSQISEAETTSFEDYKKYLYLQAYVDSRNEIIEELVKAFDKLDNFSSNAF